MCIKQKLEFLVYNKCLELNQVKNKIKDLEKTKLAVDSLIKNHKEFVKNNRLILKSLQSFRNKKHNVIAEKIEKIALSANKDNGIQSINSIETHAYGTAKYLVF